MQLQLQRGQTFKQRVHICVHHMYVRVCVSLGTARVVYGLLASHHRPVAICSFGPPGLWSSFFLRVCCFKGEKEHAPARAWTWLRYFDSQSVVLGTRSLLLQRALPSTSGSGSSNSTTDGAHRTALTASSAAARRTNRAARNVVYIATQ